MGSTGPFLKYLRSDITRYPSCINIHVYLRFTKLLNQSPHQIFPLYGYTTCGTACRTKEQVAKYFYLAAVWRPGSASAALPGCWRLLRTPAAGTGLPGPGRCCQLRGQGGEEGERGRRREEHKAGKCCVVIDNLNVVHRNLVHVMMRS